MPYRLVPWSGIPLSSLSRDATALCHVEDANVDIINWFLSIFVEILLRIKMAFACLFHELHMVQIKSMSMILYKLRQEKAMLR